MPAALRRLRRLPPLRLLLCGAMGQHLAPADGRENATFQLSGGGLTGDERRLLREQWAVHFLSYALKDSGAFEQHAADVRAWALAAERVVAAWERAGRYAEGHRRRAIARLLLFAADDPQFWPVRVAIRAQTVAEDRPGRSGTYQLGDAFATPLVHGARYIARQGAGRCLTAEGDTEHLWCGNPAAAPSVYCRRHERADEHRGELHAWRRRQARRVFELAGPAILAGPRLPLEVEVALSAAQERSARR